MNKWDLLQGCNAGLTAENPAVQNPLHVLTENCHGYVMDANWHLSKFTPIHDQQLRANNRGASTRTLLPALACAELALATGFKGQNGRRLPEEEAERSPGRSPWGGGGGVAWGYLEAMLYFCRSFLKLSLCKA